MSSSEIVSPPASDARRVFAIAWAGIFFVLINCAALLAPHRDVTDDRLPYDPAYEDVRAVLDRIEREERPVVVMIGGSVAWGMGHDGDQTIAARVQEGLAEHAAVFNLGMVGARPLDEFLLAWAVRDSADLIVLDYNYELGVDVPRERLLREPDTYVRHRQLLSAVGADFFRDAPEQAACFEAWGIDPPQGATAIDRAGRRFFEAFVPLVRRRNDVNAALFGRHPLAIAERILRDGGKVVRGTMPASELLRPPLARIETDPWMPPPTPEERAVAERYAGAVFPRDTLRGCQTEAFARYAERAGLPVIAYLTPLNAAMFPGLHADPARAENARMFAGLFDPVPFFDLDGGTLPPEAFTDSTHLTAFGASSVADALLPHVLPRLPVR